MTMRAGVLILLCSLCAAGGAVTNYTDNFNDVVEREHNWLYWGIPTGGGPTQDQAVVWMANGGVGGSSRVTLDLQNARNVYGGYWPQYLVEGMRDEDQELNFINHSVSAVFNSHNDTNVFNNGTLHFFVGEWQDESNYSFYYHNAYFVVNEDEGDWSQYTTVDITGGDSDWTLLAGDNPVSVSNLFNNPQQCGFVIIGAESQPLQNLSMDNFSAVELIPEPGVLALLASGLALLYLQRRR